ncbi:MAG: carbohydrate kinase family protein [Rhizobiaceae bacterium]|nr:carbohydrate kinase family protein [Rhizobiaceae bacterium]
MSGSRLPRLLGVGGAHIDRRGRVAGVHVAGASNPGAMREDVGGGVFNALRSAVQRGVAASLVSVRGGDLAGETVARMVAQAGIEDHSAVFLDRSTASYTALLDAEGDLITALADMVLYEVAFPRQLRRSKVRDAAAASDAVLCDANLPAAALRTLLSHAADKPVYAIAISPAKAVRLDGMLEQVACLFMNRREAAALGKLPADADPAEIIAALRDQGLRSGVITAGSQPLTLFGADFAVTVSPPVPRMVSDVTGAGDALAGATVAAMMHGAHLLAAVREGVAAAILTLESSKAAAELSTAEFAAALARVPQPLSL